MSTFNNQGVNIPSPTNQGSSSKQKAQSYICGDEKNMFFTHQEMIAFLREDYENIILKMTNNMPYINYEVAKNVFEGVIGNNYSLEILSYEFIPEFDTFMVHVRFTLVRDDKKIIKDVIGCETATRSTVTNEIQNFHNLPKSAVKDAFKKFLSDYIGIGSIQYMKEKRAYEEQVKLAKLNKQNNVQVNNGQVYNCSDCNAVISPKVHAYSVNYHSQKRPLCPNCQKKY